MISRSQTFLPSLCLTRGPMAVPKISLSATITGFTGTPMAVSFATTEERGCGVGLSLEYLLGDKLDLRRMLGKPVSACLIMTRLEYHLQLAVRVLCLSEARRFFRRAE